MERRRDVSEVIEIPQKKKNIVLKRILISVLVIFTILIFASVVGVMFYMNSIGINFIDTQDSIQNDNTDDKVLFEDIADEETCLHSFTAGIQTVVIIWHRTMFSISLLSVLMLQAACPWKVTATL